MIETTARVVSTDNGTVLVEPSTQSGCGGCQSRSVCGVSGLGEILLRQPQGHCRALRYKRTGRR